MSEPSSDMRAEARAWVRPRLAPKARLRFDPRSGRWLLLYPEKGLVLNATATDILRLCTGEHTLATIVDRLAATYAGRSRAEIEVEVATFLGTLADRGLVGEAP